MVKYLERRREKDDRKFVDQILNSSLNACRSMFLVLGKCREREGGEDSKEK